MQILGIDSCVKAGVVDIDQGVPVGERRGFPCVIRDGRARTASNVARAWLDTDVATLFADATGCPIRLLNDAGVDLAAKQEHKSPHFLERA